MSDQEQLRPWQHHDAITLAVGWDMAEALRHDAKTRDLAAAWLHAASQDWIAPGDLPGDAISTAEPHAREKVRARSIFIQMLASYPDAEDGAQFHLVLDALAAAPWRWQQFRSAANFLNNFLRVSTGTMQDMERHVPTMNKIWKI